MICSVATLIDRLRPLACASLLTLSATLVLSQERALTPAATANILSVQQPPETRQLSPILSSILVPAEIVSPGFGESSREERSEEPIETDRDSFTPATKTVGQGRFVIESAYSFLDNRNVKNTNSAPELLVRYGLTDRLELRLGWNYEVGGAANDASGIDAGGEDFASKKKLVHESTLAYGLKYQLADQDGLMPQSAVILQGFTPTSGKANDSNLVATYVFGWELPNQWKLDSAIRYGTESEGEDRFNTWAPSVVLKVPIGERIGIHAEYFGIFSTGKAEEFVQHFLSPGVHYLITRDLEVGVRLGWGLNDQSPRFFSNVGFGWRF